MTPPQTAPARPSDEEFEHLTHAEVIREARRARESEAAEKKRADDAEAEVSRLFDLLTCHHISGALDHEIPGTPCSVCVKYGPMVKP